jgi:putative ABC transport system substrate-binding protein
MNRRDTVLALLVLGALQLSSEVRPAGKVARIGFLSVSSASAAASPSIEAFGRGLSDLGYVEGQSVIVEYYWAEGQYERLPALAAKLVEHRVDVIVAPSTPAAVAAKKATKTVPIVFATVTDPVGLGLVASLARPGGNATGLTIVQSPEIVSKQLEILKEALPNLSRVAVLGNPTHPANTLWTGGATAAAESLGVRLQFLEARKVGELESAFRAITRARADGLLVLPDTMLWAERARLADLVAKSQLPAMFGFREHVEAGGLMAYGASIPDLIRRAATFVDKILKGAKPADLPVEQPIKFELVINLKTAKTLGVTIPPSLLLQADRVIE